MVDNIEEFVLCGYYHFDSKDKTKHYYVVQLLANNKENETNNRATLIPVFVERKIFEEIILQDIGSLVKCNIKPNFATNKVSYKILL